ncbi:UNVERIFIED_CONTAM: protein SPIRRIG [Sesamum radiatum]|uniref:Protein SPIRRIG n=1 Tax=Sesamum radiatum TaxID=300843 RepID=A0AAW2USH9_SESRA
MFGKPVYPRLPEVRMLDFHALMPSDSSCGELKFVELLESVIAMAKSTFDRIVMQSMLAHQTGNLSQIGASLVAELVDGNVDMAGELQGEALMHKTYAARLMGGDASAPAATTSVLRFMGCSCCEMAKELTVKTEDKNLNDYDDSTSSHNTFSSLPQEHEMSGKTSISIGSFPQGNVSASSEDTSTIPHNMASEKPEIASVATVPELDKSVKEDAQAVVTGDGEALDQLSNATSGSNEFNFCDTKSTPDHINQNDSQSSISLTLLESPISSERSSSRIPLTQSSSPVLALTSWLGSASNNDIKVQPVSVASMDSSMSVNDTNSSSDLKAASQTQSASNTLFVISPKLMLAVDDSGYGGGPCSAGATAVLDFLAEGLCLTRLMKFPERRLLRDDEEDEKKLDKARWSSNLDALSWMIVDRMYMGAFPQPAGILKTLEFLLSCCSWQIKMVGLKKQFQLAKDSFLLYITGSAKFPGVRIKGMDSRKREVGRKSRTSQNWSKDIGIRCLFNILTGKSKDESFNAELYDESTFKESDDARDIAFSGVGWNDDRESSINEASLHSATEFGVKSSAASTHRAESIRGKSELGSPRQSSSLRTDEVRISEDKTDKELNDNGEYLIRPYLEPFERIKYKYNCERVVGLDKHDGIFFDWRTFAVCH